MPTNMASRSARNRGTPPRVNGQNKRKQNLTSDASEDELTVLTPIKTKASIPAFVEESGGHVVDVNKFSWTLWKCWSKRMYKAFTSHTQSNYLKYSKFGLAKKFYTTLHAKKMDFDFSDDKCQMFEIGAIGGLVDLGNESITMSIEATEMRCANNMEGNQTLPKWRLRTYRELSQVLFDTLQVGDYLAVWGARFDTDTKTTYLNNPDRALMPETILAIYRHNAFQKPANGIHPDIMIPSFQERNVGIFFSIKESLPEYFVQQVYAKANTSQVNGLSLSNDHIDSHDSVHEEEKEDVREGQNDSGKKKKVNEDAAPDENESDHAIVPESEDEAVAHENENQNHTGDLFDENDNENGEEDLVDKNEDEGGEENLADKNEDDEDLVDKNDNDDGVENLADKNEDGDEDLADKNDNEDREEDHADENDKQGQKEHLPEKNGKQNSVEDLNNENDKQNHVVEDHEIPSTSKKIAKDKTRHDSSSQFLSQDDILIELETQNFSLENGSGSKKKSTRRNPSEKSPVKESSSESSEESDFGGSKSKSSKNKKIMKKKATNKISDESEDSEIISLAASTSPPTKKNRSKTTNKRIKDDSEDAASASPPTKKNRSKTTKRRKDDSEDEDSSYSPIKEKGNKKVILDDDSDSSCSDLLPLSRTKKSTRSSAVKISKTKRTRSGKQVDKKNLETKTRTRKRAVRGKKAQVDEEEEEEVPIVTLSDDDDDDENETLNSLRQNKLEQPRHVRNLHDEMDNEESGRSNAVASTSQNATKDCFIRLKRLPQEETVQSKTSQSSSKKLKESTPAKSDSDDDTDSRPTRPRPLKKKKK